MYLGVRQMKIGLLQLGRRDQSGNKNVRTLFSSPALLCRPIGPGDSLQGTLSSERTLPTGLAPGENSAGRVAGAGRWPWETSSL